jgi:hypothetical protein
VIVRGRIVSRNPFEVVRITMKSGDGGCFVDVVGAGTVECFRVAIGRGYGDESCSMSCAMYWRSVNQHLHLRRRCAHPFV